MLFRSSVAAKRIDFFDQASTARAFLHSDGRFFRRFLTALPTLCSTFSTSRPIRDFPVFV